MNIKFSIVIPIFNSEKFISKCIESVIQQNYKNWEIIIVDNNSTDKSVKIIKSFRNKKIKIYKIRNNGIIAKSRNLGILKSKGNWIAFLDSDDYWHTNKLNYCAKSIEVENIDFIYHDLDVEGEGKKFIQNMISTKLKKPIIKNLLIQGNIIGNSSVVVRKNLLTKVGLIDTSKKMITSEDYNMHLKIAEISNNFKYINKKLGTYRIHTGNISKKNFDWSISAKYSAHKFYHYLNEKELRLLKNNLIYLKAKYYFDNKKIKKANNFLKKSLISGRIGIKFKSLFFIIVIFFRKISN